MSEESPTAIHTRAAVAILEEVAAEYGGYITYGGLQKEVSNRTGVPSTQRANTWGDRVLGKVIEHCEEHGLPPLTSLVVRVSDGGVGRGFSAALEASGREPVSDQRQLEVIAAEDRLTCYRVYSSDVPVDAEPALTRLYEKKVARKDKPEPRQLPICGTCGVQKPATGICDNCG